MTRRPRRPLVRAAGPAIVAALLAGACVPYAVGTTAHTVRPREVVSSSSIYFIPDGNVSDTDSTELPHFGSDADMRMGLTERSDVGLRLPGGIGAVVSYKHRLTARDDSRSAAAVLVGAGILNLGDNAYFDLGLLVSGPARSTVTPYGGVRAIQTLGLGSGERSGSPTFGGFAGVRLGSEDLGLSPEIGVYYDHASPDLRGRRVIFVPSVTVYPAELLARLFGGRPALRRALHPTDHTRR